MVIAIIIVIALAVAGVVVFVVLKGNSQVASKPVVVQPDVVYMGASGWSISYSPGMPKNPTGAGSGWYFDFPSTDGVHMIMVPYNAHKPHNNLTMTYQVKPLSGTPKFISADPGSGGPASFRPTLERVGDQLLASQEFYRWWSTPVVLDADGSIHTAVWPLTFDKWTGVFGKSNATEFATTWNGNLMAVGISFGGDFAAHGVYVSGGKAQFELIDYAIT